MLQKTTLFLLLLLISSKILAQAEQQQRCGQKEAMENFFLANPVYKNLHQQIETQLYLYNRSLQL